MQDFRIYRGVAALYALFSAALVNSFRGTMHAPRARAVVNPAGSKLRKRFAKGAHVRGY